MPDNEKVSQKAEITSLVEATDWIYIVRTGTPNLSKRISVPNARGSFITTIPGGRLTLETGVPVSTTDQVDKVTLYYTPYIHNVVQLYNGTEWLALTFTELSLDISAFTASKPYDIWIYNNSGTATLDSTVWTDATTRATALAYQDGRLVKSGDATRLYLGTIYMDAASKCQDKLLARFVSNFYNRVARPMFKNDATSHTYNSTDGRAWNNSTANKVEYVAGFGHQITVIISGALKAGADAANAYFGAALDSFTVLDTDIGYVLNSNAQYISGGAVGGKFTPIGYHYVGAQEYGDAGNAASFTQFQLKASVEG